MKDTRGGEREWGARRQRRKRERLRRCDGEERKG